MELFLRSNGPPCNSPCNSPCNPLGRNSLGIAGWIALCSNMLFARIEWRLIARVTRMDRQAFAESSLVCLEHLEAGGTRTLSTGASFAICALGNAA